MVLSKEQRIIAQAQDVLFQAMDSQDLRVRQDLLEKANRMVQPINLTVNEIGMGRKRMDLLLSLAPKHEILAVGEKE